MAKMTGKRNGPQTLADVTDDELLSFALSDLSLSTTESYTNSLNGYRRFRDADSIGAALREICPLSDTEATRLFDEYKAYMKAKGRSPVTIDKNLTRLMSSVRQLRKRGLTSLLPEKPNRRWEPSSVDPSSFLGLAFIGLNRRSAFHTKFWLGRFARFRNETSTEVALRKFMRLSYAQANSVVSDFQESLKTEGLEQAAINVHIVAIRRAVKNARLAGRTLLALDTHMPRPNSSERAQVVSDETFESLLLIAESDAVSSPTGLRDLAVLTLLRAMRRNAQDLVSLDLVDVNTQDAAVTLHGKAYPLDSEEMTRVNRWIGARGTWAGPLFLSMTGRRSWQRLSTHTVWAIVKDLGRRCNPPMELTLRMVYGVGAAVPDSEYGIIVFESHKYRPIIRGRVRRCRFGAKSHNIIKTLIRYKDASMDSNDLANLSGVPHAQDYVHKLRKRDQILREEIETPGLNKKGSFRIGSGIIRPNPSD